MEHIKIKGKVIDKEEAKNITDNFQKGSCVIETDEQYPQFITVDFVNKNVDKLKCISVVVSFVTLLLPLLPLPQLIKKVAVSPKKSCLTVFKLSFVIMLCSL